jgi:hypothetical protein
MGTADDHDDEEVPFIAADGMPTLSRDAFQLHGFGLLNSIKDGHPGFVSDDYLNNISADTTVSAAELEAAGMWERRDGGYFVVHDEMLKMMLDQGEESDRLQAECSARGRHLAPALPEEDDGGWRICTHCGIPMSRPDGGPVALPNGGSLGADPREHG